MARGKAKEVLNTFRYRLVKGEKDGTISTKHLCAEMMMSIPLDKLKSAISELALTDRIELARYLLHSLEAPDEGAAAEWLALAEKRMEEVRAGRAIGISADQVMQSLRRPRS